MQRVPRESESGNKGEMQAGRGSVRVLLKRGEERGKGENVGVGAGAGRRFRHPATERDGCRRWVMTSGPRLVVREEGGEVDFFFFSNKFSKLLSNGI